jgi:hypothetical protein
LENVVIAIGIILFLAVALVIPGMICARILSRKCDVDILRWTLLVSMSWTGVLIASGLPDDDSDYFEKSFAHPSPPSECPHCGKQISGTRES